MKDSAKKENSTTPLPTAIAGYVLAIFLCVIFSLFLSGKTGWMFVYAFAAIPLFSLVVTLTIYYSQSLSIEVEADKTMVYKNEMFKLNITVRNKSFFPVPAVMLNVNIPDGIRICGTSESDRLPTENNFLLSVMPRRKTVFSINCKAEMWGGGDVGIVNARLIDFTRFFSFRLYSERGEKRYITNIRVFPNIPDVPSDMPLIRSVSESIRFNSDSESTKESDGAAVFTGMPGYNHREYVEGDPIKRINWKLSSKKDMYMIRLDDEIEAMQQTVVLDSIGYSAVCDEKAIEGMLAVLFSLFRLGFEATVWYNTPAGFISTEINDYGDIAALQTELASYRFITGKTHIRIPTDELMMEKGSSILLIAPCLTKELSGEIGVAAESGIGITVCTSLLAPDGAAEQVWLFSEDYSAELL